MSSNNPACPPCFRATNTTKTCPVPVGNTICGETNSLEIMKEFNKMYEDRMERMDTEAGGDCLGEKIKLQQEWIRNLTQQNEMLVKAVQELEYEATERVQQLEEKLHKSAQCLCEVMKKYRENDFVADLLAEPLQKIAHLEHDLENVLEFVRRARENKNWSLDGLFFYNVSKQQLMGMSAKKSTLEDSNEGEKMLLEKDKTVSELSAKIQSFSSSLGNMDKISLELEMRKKECDSLKQEMADMRQVLTEEVATKHDQTVALKKELQQLEERCVQADKQTAFKEDIIKELRKEIKQLKQQITEKYLDLVATQIESYFEKHTNINNNYSSSCVADSEKKSLEEKLKNFERENQSLKVALLANKSHLDQLDRQFRTYIEDRDELNKRNKSWEKKTKSICKEKEAMLCKCENLQEDIGYLKEKNKQLQNEVQKTKSQLESANSETKNYKEKLQKIAKENEKSNEQIESLNKENYDLSCSISVLRDRSEYTSNFTNEEIGKMNVTIGELRSTLERTKIVQEEEERAHEEEIESLNDTISSLQQQLQISKENYEKDLKTCKICRGKSKVGFRESSEIQVNLDNNDPGLVKIINDTKAKMTCEIDKRNFEIESLKTKIGELTAALNMCEERAANLQEAVALYSNSINVLESSREEAKCQIDNQKVTIVNLQRALVQAKNDADVLRKKGEDNENYHQPLTADKFRVPNLLPNNKHRKSVLPTEIITNMVDRIGEVATNQVLMEDMEDENEFYKQMVENLYSDYEKLQNLNLDLELEHCDSLQDVDTLEYQLNKIKLLLKLKEEQLKKLAKQKKCYEEVIAYFKKEMGMMAEQLGNLQQLLTLSNETAQQESAKLMKAFEEVQTQNKQLSSQLSASEQKVQLENQQNLLHQTKIAELQILVKDKEAELSKHNETISNIQQTLNESIKTNEDLQKTVKDLNDTVGNLQCAITRYEQENCASKRSCQQFQQQIGGYCNKLEDLKRNLDEKTAESLKLEMAYNNEKRQLQSVQRQLQETEKLLQQNQNSLVNSLEEYKEKLSCSDENNARLCAECENLQSQMANLTRKEAVKDLEIKRYRKIVGDLKSTMMELNTELNKNLAHKELKGCKLPNCRKRIEKDDPKNLDVCLTCPCEVEFYQKMVENLKNSLTDLKTQLKETQQKNQQLEAELQQKDGEIIDLKQSKDELNQKLFQLRMDNKKIDQLQQEIDQLNQELRVRSMQLTDVKKSANEINSSKCVQLACAQEEIGNLKNELSNYLNKQYLLKKENDQLQSELAQHNCTLCCLNDKIKMLKDQVDQNLFRIKNLCAEKETLMRKNRELLNELRSMQSVNMSVDKQQRLSIDSLKQLEADIEELKSNKEEICSESRNVIKNVRAWVLEQKRINSFVVQRELQFLVNELPSNDSGDKEIQGPIPRPPSPPLENRQSKMRCKCGANRQPMCAAKRAQVCAAKRSQMCTSPCSLGSQGRGGSASIYGDSPPTSPDFGLGNEWYATNFQTQTESEADSEEDYCTNTLEQLTEQMRKTNKCWIDEKCNLKVDRRVSKDK